MKILRLTRHASYPEQLAELRRIYGEDIEVLWVSETVPSGERVKELVVEFQADVLEAVLPLPILAECFNPKNGIKVPIIRAAMVRKLEDDLATFEFSHYERVLKVLVETERL